MTMLSVILQMGWPAAVVLVTLIVGLVVVYGIGTAAREETKRLRRESTPARTLIDHDGD